MERKFAFNYEALDNYINEQQKNTIGRTDGELTMLRDNCKKYLLETADNLKEFVISINEDNWDISINWQKWLEDKFRMIPTWYEMSNKSRLYRQVKLSMESAERLGIFDQIFKEVRVELDSLRDSINN